MAEPSYIGSGSTPKFGDTKLILLAKLLGALINMVSTLVPLWAYPHRWDTRRVLRVKILFVRNIIALNPPGPGTGELLTDPEGNYITDPEGNYIGTP